MTLVCTEVEKSKGAVTMSFKEENLSSPFPVNLIFVDTDENERAIFAQSAEEIANHLSLDCSADTAEQIEEYGVDGTVYCTLCPHALEVSETRQLIFASNLKDLEDQAHLALMCI